MKQPVILDAWLNLLTTPRFFLFLSGGEDQGEVSSSSSSLNTSIRGPWFLKPKKKQKRGCLIKDFRHDGKGGRHPGDFRAVFSLPLNGSITLRSSPRQSLSRGPWCLKQKKRQKHGFPIKDFGNDGKYYKGALPPYKPPKEKNMKTKEKDQK